MRHNIKAGKLGHVNPTKGQTSPYGDTPKNRSIMIESQGTTPENTQASTTPATLDEALIKGSELQLEILELKSKNTELARDLMTWSDRYETAQAVIDKARVMFQEILAGDMDPEGTIEEFRAPFELLGVEFTQEVEVEITATWTVTVTKPFGHELEGDDFSVDLDNDNNEIKVHDSWHTPDVEVREL
jgi:hypothetical protein